VLPFFFYLLLILSFMLALVKLHVVIPFVQYLLKIFGQFAVEAHSLAGSGVCKAQGFGMQRLPGHKLKTVLYESSVFAEGRTFQYLVAAVGGIVEERMPKMLHVGAYLMCAACLQIALYQRYIPEWL
jgi:hypothetical protein